MSKKIQNALRVSEEIFIRIIASTQAEILKRGSSEELITTIAKYSLACGLGFQAQARQTHSDLQANRKDGLV